MSTTTTTTTATITARVITAAELSQHNTRESLWVSVHGKVYDLSSFAPDHPGGLEPLLECAGNDATEPFDYVGHGSDAIKTMSQFLIGKAEGGSGEEAPAKATVNSTASIPKPAVKLELSLKHKAAFVVGLLGAGAYIGVRKTGLDLANFSSGLTLPSFDSSASLTTSHVVLASFASFTLILVVAAWFLYEQFNKTLNYEKDVFTYPSVIPRKTQRTFKAVAFSSS